MVTRKPVKTANIEILAHQAAVHPITIISDPIDCSDIISALIFLYHGYVEATADTNYGKFIVQVRPDEGNSAENENWVDVKEFTAKGVTPASEQLTATEPIGEKILAVASTTGFTVGDDLYIQDVGTLLDSEWGKLKTLVTNTNLQLIDGLKTQKDSSDIVFNGASMFCYPLNLEYVKSFRVIWTHEGATGANGHIKALASLYDSDSIV